MHRDPGWIGVGGHANVAPVSDADHRDLVDYLVGLGASDEDLREYAENLRGLASVLVLRLGRPTLSLSAMAARAGVSGEVMTQRWRAAGFPDPGPDAPVASQAEAEFFATLAHVERLFGRDAVMSMTRVLGSATARIADAAVSTFLLNIPLPPHASDLEVAKANTQGLTLLPVLLRGMEVLLRRHILNARRSLLDTDRSAGVEVQQLAVGFVDLVDSTALAQRLSTAELNAALGEFEALAADTITDAGGRLVKLIGDEVMYSAADALVACRIAVRLIDTLRTHPRLPRGRGGVALGAVMVRDGDCFGPIVNLAARAVKHAAPSHVVAAHEVADAVRGVLRVTSLPEMKLAGFDAPVVLYDVAAASAA